MVLMLVGTTIATDDDTRSTVTNVLHDINAEASQWNGCRTSLNAEWSVLIQQYSIYIKHP